MSNYTQSLTFGHGQNKVLKGVFVVEDVLMCLSTTNAHSIVLPK